MSQQGGLNHNTGYEEPLHNCGMKQRRVPVEERPESPLANFGPPDAMLGANLISDDDEGEPPSPGSLSRTLGCIRSASAAEFSPTRARALTLDLCAPFSYASLRHTQTMPSLKPPNKVSIQMSDLQMLQSNLQEREAEKQQAVEMGLSLLARIQSLNEGMEDRDSELLKTMASVLDIQDKYANAKKRLESELVQVTHYQNCYLQRRPLLKSLHTKVESIKLMQKALTKNPSSLNLKNYETHQLRTSKILRDKLLIYAEAFGLLGRTFARWTRWFQPRVIHRLRNDIKDSENTLEDIRVDHGRVKEAAVKLRNRLRCDSDDPPEGVGTIEHLTALLRSLRAFVQGTTNQISRGEERIAFLKRTLHENTHTSWCSLRDGEAQMGDIAAILLDHACFLKSTLLQEGHGALTQEAHHNTMATLQAQCVGLKEQMGSLKLSSQRRRMTHLALLRRTEDAVKDTETYKAEVTAVIRMITEVQAAKDRSHAEIKIVKKRETDLQDVHTELQRMIKALEENTCKTIDKNAQLHEDIKQTKEKLRDDKNMLEITGFAVAALQTQWQQCEKIQNELFQTMVTIEKEILEFDACLLSTEETNRKLCDQEGQWLQTICDSEKENTLLEDNIAQMVSSRESLECHRKEVLENIAALGRAKAELLQNGSALDIHHESLEKEIAVGQERHRAITGHVKEHAQQWIAAEKKIALAKEAIAKFENEKHSLRLEIQIQIQEAKTREQRLSEGQALLGDLRNDTEREEQNSSAAAQEVQSAYGTLTKLEQDFRLAQEHLDDMTALRVQRQQAVLTKKETLQACVERERTETLTAAEQVRLLQVSLFDFQTLAETTREEAVRLRGRCNSLQKAEVDAAAQREEKRGVMRFELESLKAQKEGVAKELATALAAEKRLKHRQEVNLREATRVTQEIQMAQQAKVQFENELALESSRRESEDMVQEKAASEDLAQLELELRQVHSFIKKARAQAEWAGREHHSVLSSVKEDSDSKQVHRVSLEGQLLVAQGVAQDRQTQISALLAEVQNVERQRDIARANTRSAQLAACRVEEERQNLQVQHKHLADTIALEREQLKQCVALASLRHPSVEVPPVVVSSDDVHQSRLQTEIGELMALAAALPNPHEEEKRKEELTKRAEFLARDLDSQKQRHAEEVLAVTANLERFLRTEKFSP